MSAIRFFQRVFTFLLIGTLSLIAAPAWADDISVASIKIGILAFRDRTTTQARWQPLADYVQRSLPG